MQTTSSVMQQQSANRSKRRRWSEGLRRRIERFEIIMLFGQGLVNNNILIVVPV